MKIIAKNPVAWYISGMELQIFAQTFFFLTASVAIIVCGVLSAIVMYQLIFIMKHLEHISDNLDDTADDLKNRVKDMLDRLEEIPLLSYFFKKRKKRS
ncbi:MAG: hypothetical protein ABI643_00080 [Candidatus Doudnabacteria bacterium]